jgi:hypothetical protein
MRNWLAQTREGLRKGIARAWCSAFESRQAREYQMQPKVRDGQRARFPPLTALSWCNRAAVSHRIPLPVRSREQVRRVRRYGLHFSLLVQALLGLFFRRQPWNDQPPPVSPTRRRLFLCAAQDVMFAFSPQVQEAERRVEWPVVYLLHTTGSGVLQVPPKHSSGLVCSAAKPRLGFPTLILSWRFIICEARWDSAFCAAPQAV